MWRMGQITCRVAMHVNPKFSNPQPTSYQASLIKRWNRWKQEYILLATIASVYRKH